VRARESEKKRNKRREREREKMRKREKEQVCVHARERENVCGIDRVHVWKRKSTHACKGESEKKEAGVQGSCDLCVCERERECECVCVCLRACACVYVRVRFAITYVRMHVSMMNLCIDAFFYL